MAYLFNTLYGNNNSLDLFQIAWLAFAGPLHFLTHFTVLMFAIITVISRRQV